MEMGRPLGLRTLMNRADVGHHHPGGEMGFQGSEEGGRGVNSDAEKIGKLVKGHWEGWGGKEGTGRRGQKAGKSWTATQTHSSDGEGWTIPSAASQEGSANWGAVLRNPVPWTHPSFRLQFFCWDSQSSRLVHDLTPGTALSRPAWSPE